MSERRGPASGPIRRIMPAVMASGNERWECKLHPSCFGRQILRRPRATLIALRKPAYIIGFSSAGAALWLSTFRSRLFRVPPTVAATAPARRIPNPHLSFALPPSLSPSLNNSGKLFLQLVDLLLPDEETGEGRGEPRR